MPLAEPPPRDSRFGSPLQLSRCGRCRIKASERTSPPGKWCGPSRICLEPATNAHNLFKEASARTAEAFADVFQWSQVFHTTDRRFPAKSFFKILLHRT